MSLYNFISQREDFNFIMTNLICQPIIVLINRKHILIVNENQDKNSRRFEGKHREEETIYKRFKV
jgi:hypothetical protein